MHLSFEGRITAKFGVFPFCQSQELSKNKTLETPLVRFDENPLANLVVAISRGPTWGVWSGG